MVLMLPADSMRIRTLHPGYEASEPANPGVVRRQ
jgi:hypothetical protein